jgi:hypothetical protein
MHVFKECENVVDKLEEMYDFDKEDSFCEVNSLHFAMIYDVAGVSIILGQSILLYSQEIDGVNKPCDGECANCEAGCIDVTEHDILVICVARLDDFKRILGSQRKIVKIFGETF